MKQILNPFRWMMPAMAAVLLVQCGSAPEAEAEGGQAPAARLTRVGVQAVNPGPFSHSFAVQGNVQTDRVANVLAAFPGVVREVLVDEGANVKGRHCFGAHRHGRVDQTTGRARDPV